MNLKDEYLYCKENNIDFILTKDNLEEIDNEGKTINGIDDLIMVHKTDYAPKGRINSSLEAHATMPLRLNFHLDGDYKYFEREIPKYRNTVHFSLNGQARAHEYHPTLDDMKYCVLTPLSSNLNSIVGGTETDIYTIGGIELNTDSYILCPKEEINVMKDKNPNSTVVGYEGENVTPFADVFISQVLGYKYKQPTEKGRVWDHGKGKDHDLVTEIFKQNGFKETDHMYSEEMKKEKLEENIDMIIEKIKVIIEEKLLFDEKNIPAIKESLETDIGNFGIFSEYPHDCEHISDRIEEKIGIKLVDKKNPFDENSELEIMTSKELTSILRYEALTKKHELGILTDSEKDLFLETMDISKLNSDEISYFIEKINNEMQKEKISEFTPSLKRNEETDDIEMFLSFPDNYYGVAAVDLKQILLGATRNDSVFSDPSTKGCSTTKDLLYKVVDVSKKYPNSHIKGITDDEKIMTDFTASNCNNMKDVKEKAFDYLNNLHMYYDYHPIEDIDSLGVDIDVQEKTSSSSRK